MTFNDLDFSWGGAFEPEKKEPSFVLVWKDDAITKTKHTVLVPADSEDALNFPRAKLDGLSGAC